MSETTFNLNSVVISRHVGAVDTEPVTATSTAIGDAWYYRNSSTKTITIGTDSYEINEVNLTYRNPTGVSDLDWDLSPFTNWNPLTPDATLNSVNKPYYRFKLGDEYFVTIFLYNISSNQYYMQVAFDELNAPHEVFYPAHDKLQMLAQESATLTSNKFEYFKPLTFDIEGEQYFGIGLVQRVYDEDENKWYAETGHCNFAFKISDLEQIGDFDWLEHDSDYGYYSTSGGYSGGSFDDSSDVIGFPDKPSVSLSQIGFLNVYNPSVNGLTGLADVLFPALDTTDYPEITGDGSLKDIADYIGYLGKNIYNGVISMMNSKLLDFIIDTHIIPVKPTGNNATIKVGYKTTEIIAPHITDDYVDFDCGTLNISEYYQNFIDYAGTRAKLFVVGVGFVPIEPEYFQNGYLQVKYRFNIIDGSFICCVISSSSKSNLRDTVIGQFSGSMCVHIPITATNYGSMISGMVGGVSNMVNSVSQASTNPVGAVGGAIQGAVQTLSAKPDVMMSNGYNSTSSYIGLRTCYLVISREVASFPKNYAHEQGLPLNATRTIGDMSGFTTASSIVMDGLACTEKEKEMLAQAFANGVIM